jgi:hypothetical protein
MKKKLDKKLPTKKPAVKKVLAKKVLAKKSVSVPVVKNSKKNLWLSVLVFANIFAFDICGL